MSDLAAIKAVWSTYKPVPTRNCLQLVLEVPLEQQEEVFRRLGYPVPGRETWVGVALMNVQKDPEKPHKPWSQYTRAQRAGILCTDRRFRDWISEGRSECDEEDAAHLVRRMCGVQSRSLLDTSQKAADKWDSLESNYRAATGQMAEVRS
uniref:hypothetical protein n=1 Tax=Nitrospira cf. moscoviensis SBR1015 TaxID=96242 RepID=UPI000B3BC66C|nr:hypothetical protein [Nitrospira cf. moscoviensis SBR1015]